MSGPDTSRGHRAPHRVESARDGWPRYPTTEPPRTSRLSRRITRRRRPRRAAPTAQSSLSERRRRQVAVRASRRAVVKAKSVAASLPGILKGPRGNADDRCVVCNIANHGRACTDRDPRADANAFLDGRANSYPATLPYSHRPTDSRAWTHVYAIPENAIVINRCPRIYDACDSGYREWIYDASGKHDTPRAQPCSRAHYCDRVHNRDHVNSVISELSMLRQAHAIVTNANNCSIESISRVKHCARVPENSPFAGAVRTLRGVVKENNVTPPGEQSGISNHSTMATCTENRQDGQEALPVNLGIVASRSAEMS